MRKVTNVESLIHDLKGMLPDYLREHGIDTTKTHFHCINPDHDDKNPSMSMHRSGLYAKCWSCGTVVDIFTAAHFLEQKPRDGAGFVSDNVVYLAQKYGIGIETEALTEREMNRMNAFRAYEVAYDYMLKFWNDYDPKTDKVVAKELKKRQCTVEELKWLGVGFIRDFKDFNKTMLDHGFSAQFLDSIDLSHRVFGNGTGTRKPNQMFTMGTNGMIFTFKDVRGRPVGFITRDLTYTKTSKKPKFINTDSSCPIFQKGALLQNLHDVKKRRLSTVFIVEGFWDILALRRIGIYGVVAPISAAVTTAHVELMRNNGITEIIMALDGDEPGQEQVQRIVDEKFAGCHDLAVNILGWEGWEGDPDEYIREYGDKFKELGYINGFEWRLARQITQNGFDKSRPETIEPLIKLVVNEPSWIKRDGMCEALSKYTNVDISWIRNEVERFTSLKELHIEARRNEIINSMYEDIKTNPNYAEQLMDDAKQKLEDLTDNMSSSDPLDPTIVVKSVMELKRANESKGTEMPGMDCGFKTFTTAHGGIRESQHLYVFGGIPNTGKTSFMCQLAYQLIKLNPELYVLYHSTDDTSDQIIPRLICLDQYHECMQQTGMRLTLRGVDSPMYYYDSTPQMLPFIDRGYQNVVEYIRDEKLLIKDMRDRSDAKTIGYGEFLIRKARERYPSRPILYMLDNFHKCDDFPKLDERIRYKRMSGKVKDLCQKYNVTGIATMEYNKIYDQREPRNSDLSESSKMEYDINLLYHLHNEYKAFGGDTRLFWNDHTDIEEVVDAQGAVHRRPKRKPILKAICGKSKVSDGGQDLYFKFDPPSNYYEELTPSEASRLIQREASDEEWHSFNTPT